jgi:hypothetical protein
MRDRPVPRIGGVDTHGIIYIGRSEILRIRLWDFWIQKHDASAFLWTHLDMASVILNKPIRTESDLRICLGKLRARYSMPIEDSMLNDAERALIFAYIKRFGEAPPLNLSLPSRWEEPPGEQDLRWAEQGLLFDRK